MTRLLSTTTSRLTACAATFVVLTAATLSPRRGSRG